MRALITGTPVQIEGEPAEIAQLVELMSTGAVMVEHVHHFRLDLPDDQGLQVGKCWCGTEKNFAPWGETAQPRAFRIKDEVAPRSPENAVGAAVGAGRGGKPKSMRTCKLCGAKGHDVRKCPSKQAA